MPTTDLPGPDERRAAEQRILNARPIAPRRLQDLGRATIPVTVTAIGSSTASGPGNLASLFRTDANARVGVTYTYTAAVPEPTTMAGLAVASVALLRRRRRR